MAENQQNQPEQQPDINPPSSDPAEDDTNAVSNDNAEEKTPIPHPLEAHPLIHADEIVHSAVEWIWESFTDTLYAEKMEQKAGAFAANMCVKQMMSNIRLQTMFVENETVLQHEKASIPGPPPPTDNWARCCVGKKGAQLSIAALEAKRAVESGDDKRPKIGAVMGGGIGEYDHSKPRVSPLHNPLQSSLDAAEDTARVVKMEEQIYIDEEEAQYRDAKLEEERYKQDIQRRAEAEKLRQAQYAVESSNTGNLLAKGPYTFDTEGRVLWVTLPNVAKLPKVAVEPTSKITESPTAARPSPNTRRNLKLFSPFPSLDRSPEDDPDYEFPDGVLKCQDGDEAIVSEVINLAPGVAITNLNLGKTRAGPKREDKTMSVSKYARFIEEDDMRVN